MKHVSNQKICRIKERDSLVRVSFLAGDNGFEPLLVAPEATVLPLDESPIYPARRILAWLSFSGNAAQVIFYIHKDK